MSRCNICGKTNCGGPLVHLQDGHTYPIHILGNAATASDANPRVYKQEANENVIKFQVGAVKREDEANIYEKEIDFVEHAVKDSEGNVIHDTYAKKSDIESTSVFIYDGDASGSYEFSFMDGYEMYGVSTDSQLWTIHVKAFEDDTEFRYFTLADGFPKIWSGVSTIVLSGKVVYIKHL